MRITKEEIQQDLERLRHTIGKLNKPMLIQLENGDYIVKPIGARGISPLSETASNSVSLFEQMQLSMTVNDLIRELRGGAVSRIRGGFVGSK